MAMGRRNNFGPTVKNQQNKPKYNLNTLKLAWEGFDSTLSPAITRPTIAPRRVYSQMQNTQDSLGPQRNSQENVNSDTTQLVGRSHVFFHIWIAYGRSRRIG